MQKTILIIDDESTSVEVMVDMLRNKNYKILVAINGLSGYQIAQKNAVDLIISDWEMEELNGIETMLLLKNNPETNNIPIIIATGKRLLPEDLRTALETGAVDYIRKPFNPVELIARVHSVLSHFETIKENTRLQIELKEKEFLSLKKEIEIKNKDLSEKIMQIYNWEIKTKKIENKIKKIADHYSANKGLKRSLDEIISCLSDKPFKNVWDEFEIVFEEINTNFFTSIIKNFPDISPTEKKLCAFLKLNFNTKEIAAITNKTTESVQKTRHRLRKRFNLNLDEDLSSFIQRL